LVSTENIHKATSTKMPTGIPGLDDCLLGGMPRNRNTLVMGGPGCGKTVLALQTLVNGAKQYSEPGIFVAFEENSPQIIENARSFGWNIPALQKKNLFFLNAKMGADIIQTGEFDLSGLLAQIGARAKQMKAKRIVFDSVDVLLTLLDSAAARRKELYCLYDWLLNSGMTAILTAKSDGHTPVGDEQYSNMQFMADCVICLNHQLSEQISVRNLWVKKFRGSAFLENQLPLSIGEKGIEISADINIEQKVPASSQRVSTGVSRLDTMLNGGYFRGSSILVTGSPGTAKSTLAAAFVEAACKQKQRALYVSFDSSSSELVRNFSSVNIDFQPHIDAKRLLIHSVLADGCSAKDHFIRIRNLIEKHKPGCVVIDPVSALVKSGGEEHAQGMAERLIMLGRSLGITILNTSLLDSTENNSESTPVRVSTIADTWIHLSYLIKAGERNRALSIIKARGTRHSNQVRELVLSDEGITLADAYTSGGEVLMGALRWQKEHEDRLRDEQEAIRERYQGEQDKQMKRYRDADIDIAPTNDDH
jgi:circadian clock protein KaiC